MPQASWPSPDGVVARGAYHIHSIRSDGTGSAVEIARAAAEAGLQFVILTDHGDGTRAPEPPVYHHGVLCIAGVELNTSSGHYVALGLPQAPYPLAGAADAVIEDVRRLGGFGVAAHADSPRASLRWEAWQAAFDGVEWLNADSEWRDESWLALDRLLLTYPWRSVEALAATLDRPAASLARWDAIGRSRRVVGLAGADAHARLGLRQQTDPYEERLHVKVPSYASTFGMFSTRVVLDRPQPPDAAVAAEAVLQELRLGRVFTVIDGLAGPGAFEFTATSGPARAYMGEYLDVHGPVAVHVRASAPQGATIVVLRDGVAVHESVSQELHVDVGATPGVYRVEVRLAGTDMPWIVSNPIYAGLRSRHDALAAAAALPPATVRTAVALGAVPEASDGSRSVQSPATWPDGAAAVLWDFSLAGGAAAGQFAALRFPADAQPQLHDRVHLRVRADRPMRVWLQLRAARSGGARWGRSFYADQTPRQVELSFRDFRPLEEQSGVSAPPLNDIDGILIVADTVNTRPGSSGQLSIADLWLIR